MGICMSSAVISCAALGGGCRGAPVAIVILMDGSYYQFSGPAKAQQILRESPDDFICNSDCLYIGQKMRELLPFDELEMGQIYFLLPRKKLQFVVSESDMACLLYKANSALKQMCTKYGVGDYIQPNFYTDPQIGERSARAEEEKLKFRSEQLNSLSRCAGSNNSMFGSPRKQWRAKLDTIVEVA